MYNDKSFGEVTSSVRAAAGDVGEADISIELEAAYGAHEVRLCSRVSREDLPKLVLELYSMVAADLRPTLLDSLRDQG